MTGRTRTLTDRRADEFSVEQLAREASRWLRAAPGRSADGRVADLPDTRGIRFYQTLGLLDRPLRYDGRRAVYGYTHLLQVLAIKQLQREGYTLQLIQAALPARSRTDLELALTDWLAGPAPAPPPPAARPVLTAEVVPGVTVIVDPARVSNVDRVWARITEALQDEGEQDS